MVKLLINGKRCEMQVDIAADFYIMSRDVYEDVFSSVAAKVTGQSENLYR